MLERIARSWHYQVRKLGMEETVVDTVDANLKRDNALIDDKRQRCGGVWSTIRMLVIVIIVAVTVWFACAVMRYVIHYLNVHFLGDFHSIWAGNDFSNASVEKTGGVSNIQAARNMQDSFMVKHPGVLWDLTLLIFCSAVVRAILVHWESWRKASGDGVIQSLQRFHSTYKVNTPECEREYLVKIYKENNLTNALKRIVITIMTLSACGSGGLEGPIVPIGDRIGCALSRLFGITEMDEMRSLVMAGISAGISTLLHAPFTAALFSAEIVFAGSIRYRKLSYSLLAAVVAYECNASFLSQPPLFVANVNSRVLNLQSYLEVVVVAVLFCAPAGYLFKLFLTKLRSLFMKIPEMVRAPLAAILIVAIVYTLWFGFGLEPYHILGLGEDTIAQVFAGYGNPMLQIGGVLFLLVIAKMLATGLTLVAGGSAGILVPTMYLGGLTGAGMFYFLLSMGVPLSNTSPDFYMVVGLASALVTVVSVPLATIAFVLEIFGTDYGPPAIIAVVICHIIVQLVEKKHENSVSGD